MGNVDIDLLFNGVIGKVEDRAIEQEVKTVFRNPYIHDENVPFVFMRFFLKAKRTEHYSRSA